MQLRIGTAGWTIPRAVSDAFPGGGSHLERYAARFNCAEINSSFYRQHKRAVYAKWANAVPDEFRFSVKVPRAVTHDQMLVAADVLLEVFLEEVAGLGGKLGALLVQLPASQPFLVDVADEFFTLFRGMHAGPMVCEPRHASWFTHAATTLLTSKGVARVAADPACVAEAATPGASGDRVYYRLHGSPRIYWSAYGEEFLTILANALTTTDSPSAERWCIFDNTASGAAAGDALKLQRLME